MIETIQMTQDQMACRIARFRDLKPLPSQQNSDIPLAARDLVFSRQLLSVIGLEDASSTPINSLAPIRGAAGMTMTLAVCPPGQGPDLHAHRMTYETFTVLRGRFEFLWNDHGEYSVVLQELDTISLPPGVCRAFRNVGEKEGVVQVLITGGVHDMQDIDFATDVARRIEAVGPGLTSKFEAMGFSFTAAAQNAAHR